MEKQKKEFRMPHTMAILFCCVIFVAVLTYLIPAGSYERITNAAGTTVVDPNSFTYIDPAPVSFIGVLASITKGFSGSASIIALTLFSGGAIMILRRIGVIDAAMSTLARKFEGKGIMVIPVLMTIFTLIDNFIGTPELCMVYIPIVMPLMFRLGFDSITCMATVVLGSAAGFSAAIANPFTVVVGQKVCELPLYSGWQFRMVTLAVTLVIGIMYVTRYAKKVLKDPTSSSMYLEDASKRAEYLSKINDQTLSPRKKIAGIWAIAVFAFAISGTLLFHWDMPELTGMFLLMGIGAGLIAGMDVRNICISIADGCKDVMMGAIFIALARATYVVMTDGKIIDSIVHSMAGMLGGLPAWLTVVGILALVTVLNFFVSSGSGKAVMLFPILSPLADLCGITRQTAVLAYQFGDGFTNMFWPTNGVQGACLGIAGIPWNKWARFYFPLLIMWYIMALVFLFVAQSIPLGPF